MKQKWEKCSIDLNSFIRKHRGEAGLRKHMPKQKSSEMWQLIQNIGRGFQIIFCRSCHTLGKTNGQRKKRDFPTSVTSQDTS